MNIRQVSFMVGVTSWGQRGSLAMAVSIKIASGVAV